MDISYSAKILSGLDVDMIQYCQDYISILDTANARYDTIIQDRLEFTKFDEQQRTAQFSSPFRIFLSICEDFKEVIDQLKQMLEDTKQLSKLERNTRLREHLFNKSSEPTRAKFILDGIIGFYCSPRGNLLKKKDYSDSYAYCHGVLSLIPGNKMPCNYIVKPERVHKALGGILWHGQPNLRSDHSVVGLCPTCMKSLLRTRINFRLANLTTLRKSLGSKSPSHATDKERQLTRELESLQSDLEKISHVVLETEHEEINDEQALQSASSEADMEFIPLLRKQPVEDLPESHEEKKKEMQGLILSLEDSSSSEQKEYTARMHTDKHKRLTRAAKKKAVAKKGETKANEKETLAQQTRQVLNEMGTSKESSILSKRADDIENNTNALPVLGQKRKRKEDDQQSLNKRRKKQPTPGNTNSTDERNVGAAESKSVLTIRIDDTICSYPVTASQVFLFHAIATLVSPEFAKNSKMRATYQDSISHVDLATLSLLKEMLLLAYAKKCEHMGLK